MRRGRGTCELWGGLEERGDGGLGREGGANNGVELPVRDSEVRDDLTFGEASTAVVERGVGGTARLHGC